MRKLSILNPIPSNMDRNSTVTQTNNLENLNKINAYVSGNKPELIFRGYNSNKEKISTNFTNLTKTVNAL
jgi:hypothetical protein